MPDPILGPCIFVIFTQRKGKFVFRYGCFRFLIWYHDGVVSHYDRLVFRDLIRVDVTLELPTWNSIIDLVRSVLSDVPDVVR